jgi:hypothetical protein
VRREASLPRRNLLSEALSLSRRRKNKTLSLSNQRTLLPKEMEIALV